MSDGIIPLASSAFEAVKNPVIDTKPNTNAKVKMESRLMFNFVPPQYFMYFSCTLLAYANHTKGIISLVVSNCQYARQKNICVQMNLYMCKKTGLNKIQTCFFNAFTLTPARAWFYA